MFVLCLLLWMILNGRITWEIAGFGIAVSAAVTFAARKLTGQTRQKEWAVIRMVYRKAKPDPCLKQFSAPLRTTAARVFLADSITLTPGTITAEQDGPLFTVHCLDRSMSEGLEQSCFVRRLHSLEKQEGSHEV